MAVTADMVRQLRERTGAGVLECRNALEETGGQIERAVELLRERGLAKAAKKAGRETRQGLVEAYTHGGGRVGALIELNCETDFVARTPQFRELAHDLAMQVVATNPTFMREEDVPAAVLEQEDDHERFLAESVLLRQPFIKNPNVTIGQLITEKIAQMGENIVLRRFARFELGGYTDA